jgi:hypothetical protein
MAIGFDCCLNPEMNILRIKIKSYFRHCKDGLIMWQSMEVYHYHAKQI